MSGICAEGADVELAGVVPTPTIAFLAAQRSAPAAMISASHNPFADNGVKLFAPGGQKLTDALEQQVEHQLHDLAVNPPPPGPEGANVGVVQNLRDSVDEYVRHVIGSLEGRVLDDISVILDCGNGAAFRTAPRIFRELGAEVEVLNGAPNGTNINDGCGSTDPTKLQQLVQESGARAGLAFDGDADRVIAVDERGGLIDGDQIMAVCALDLAERDRLRNKAVVADGDVESGASQMPREPRPGVRGGPGGGPARDRRDGATRPGPGRRAVGSHHLPGARLDRRRRPDRPHAPRRRRRHRALPLAARRCDAAIPPDPAQRVGP